MNPEVENGPIRQLSAMVPVGRAVENFRSVGRSLLEVIGRMERDGFGNQHRGSSLEIVVSSMAEQRQIFKGADHARLWKQKLRIPDIYENRQNQPCSRTRSRSCRQVLSESSSAFNGGATCLPHPVSNGRPAVARDRLKMGARTEPG